jgi:hypothetical protein
MCTNFGRLLSLSLFVAGFCSAGMISDTGSLTSPDVDPGDDELIAFTLTLPGSVTLQTYGFGGGVNGAGNTITAGGFDPFVGLFQGTGATALFLDGTADNLSNYTSEPTACPPAGLVTIGGVAGQCGDVRLQFNSLAAGMYTVVLSDADYVPNAVYETTGYLGDGFSDLTGGSLPFQTCFDASDCNTDSANWALDITTPGVIASAAPEPSSFGLAGVGFALVLIGCVRRRHSKFS